MSCCVFAETSDDSPVVVKIPFGVETGHRETTVLQAWSELVVSPRVVALDEQSGAFVMERIAPR